MSYISIKKKNTKPTKQNKKETNNPPKKPTKQKTKKSPPWNFSLFILVQTLFHPCYSTFLKNISTAFLVSKMGETMPKAFLKLRCIISTIYFCRKASYHPELLRKLKISVRFIIPISFSLSRFFKLAHYICLVSVFWHDINLSRNYQWEHFWNYLRQCFANTQMKEFSNGLILF